jgi:hypothetical protein
MLAPAAAVFSLLLIVTGLAKLARPHDVEKALSQLGLPRISGVGYLIGGAEVVVGAGALFFPQLLLAQALLYAGFAVWVFWALRSEVPIASCGCLGRADTPPTVAHVVLNVIAFSISSLAAFGAPLDISGGFAAVATGLAVLVGVYLSYVILTDAAMLAGVRKR